MPEVTIKIGQRPYTVNCPAGEEPQLQKAREALDAEASSLLAQVGRVPEAQMLPVVPPALLESLAELSARAEAAADDLEERLAQSAG